MGRLGEAYGSHSVLASEGWWLRSGFLDETKRYRLRDCFWKRSLPAVFIIYDKNRMKKGGTAIDLPFDGGPPFCPEDLQNAGCSQQSSRRARLGSNSPGAQGARDLGLGLYIELIMCAGSDRYLSILDPQQILEYTKAQRRWVSRFAPIFGTAPLSPGAREIGTQRSR
jgi:hypothetical protein